MQCRGVTRYGFAIKALPPGAKPFGEEDDENEEPRSPEEASLPGADSNGAELEPSGGAEEELPKAAEPVQDVPPADSPPGDEAVEDPAAQPPQPDDDSRPWAGDLYGEGDETDPSQAFAAYGGGDGEEAWLDKAPDGTLTGWVSDATGQVWRYTDADAWATDVDGAQMTRTQGPEGNTDPSDPLAPEAPGPGPDRGIQDDLFTSP